MDIRTLLIVYALVSGALTLVMFFFWRQHRDMPGFGLITVGFGMTAAAVALFGLRGIVHDFVSIMVANALVTYGLAWIWNGVRAFGGRPARWRAPAAAIAAMLGVLAYFAFVQEDVAVRVVANSSVLTVLSFCCAWEFYRLAPSSHRGAVWIAVAVFASIGATLAARSLTVLVHGPALNLFTPTVAQQIHFTLAIVNAVLGAFSLLLLASERLQRDIEERNTELAVLAGERNGARTRAEAANRAKSEFLANMSHELRTPLNAIIGFSEIISEATMGPVDSRSREYARDIHVAGQHLLNVINDVLDLSKIEVGRLDLNEEPVDLARTIKGCARLLGERAREQQLELGLELSPDLPVVLADARRLKQVVINLLSNAVKFTPAGGRIEVAASVLPGGDILIRVADTGIGMRREDVALALEPFRQIDSALNRRYEGTGLGLPLVRSLVELHGGSLAFDTAPGAGTRVSVTLPAERCLSRAA